MADSPALRKLMEDYLPKVTAFYAGLGVNRKLWTLVKATAKARTTRGLSALQRRHLNVTLRGFRRSGADLKPAAQAEFVELQKELSTLGEKYAQTILDATNAFEKTFPEGAEAGQLRGLPPSALSLGRTLARQKDLPGYRFTLQAPSLIALLTYAQDSALRREFNLASQKIGRAAPHDTAAMIHRILELRQRKARLLGSRDFATFAVEQRMLNTPAKIARFLRTLTSHTRRQTLADFQKLAALKKTMGDASPFEPWDRAFYAERATERELHLEAEALRPYFEFTQVRQSLFDLARTLFGVEIRKVAGHPAWHESVEYYEIHDGPRLLGGFYTDFFPRPSKRSGAWMDRIRTGRPTAQGHTPHVSLIAGNFTPPAENAPSLLTHEEALTLYHEFGHLLHDLLTEVPIASLGGTAVPRDFVELPSQLLENYCYDTAHLKTFARHHQTGAPLDDASIARLRASRKFLQALFTSRQLSFGAMDLFLHRQKSPPADLDAALEKTLRPYRLPYHTQFPSTVRSFGHLWGGGYAAGYYSYQWCNVLEADVWERFEREGILSPKIGLAYREGILAAGNSQPVDKLYRAFMGRAPKMDAYLKRLKS